jgi:hypothetical protein
VDTPFRDSSKSVARFWRSYIPAEEKSARFEFPYKTQSNAVGFMLQPLNQQPFTETVEDGRKNDEGTHSSEMY